MGSRIKPSGKVFRDPVHNLIKIEPGDEVILALIDTPEFQRLRRIRQLGVSYLTYHGAEHSRFVHSLGVFSFAQTIISRLRSRYLNETVSEYLLDHALITKCAALLHDIGHGPFSHTIERSFAGFNHEERTADLIRDPKGSIQPILGALAGDVADLIAHASPHTLLTDIVSSQLDADRMDYLLRDSLATGVQYGRYDHDWLINAMCVGLNPGGEAEKAGIRQWRLCLDANRPTDAAEQFIFAREHMSSQVYYHRVTRGYEVLLLNLFGLARDSFESGFLPSSTPESVSEFLRLEGNLDREHWLRFDEAAMNSAFHAWAECTHPSNSSLSRLAKAFLFRNPVYSSIELSLVRDQFRLGRTLDQAGLRQGIDWEIDDGSMTIYKGIRRAAKGRGGGESEDVVESILVADGHPESIARPIETVSGRFNQIDSEARSFKRLYFDRDKLDQFSRVDGFPKLQFQGKEP